MKKSAALKFMDKQNTLLLATNGLHGTPDVRAFLNIRNPKIMPHLVDFFKKNDRILLMTTARTEKIAQIRANDNASLYTFQEDPMMGLLLIGTVAEVLDEQTKGMIWDDSFVQYYPGGRESGDFSLLEFFPGSYKSFANLVVENGPIVA